MLNYFDTSENEKQLNNNNKELTEDNLELKSPEYFHLMETEINALVTIL